MKDEGKKSRQQRDDNNAIHTHTYTHITSTVKFIRVLYEFNASKHEMSEIEMPQKRMKLKVFTQINVSLWK